VRSILNLPRLVWLVAAALAFVYIGSRFAVEVAPNSNEAWFADAARNLWLKGYLGTSVLASKGTWLEGVDRHTYWAMPAHLLAQAGWYSAFGFSLTSLRFLSIAAGLAMIVGWYLVAGKLLKSWHLAGAVLLILAADVRIASYSANGRMDSFCACWGILGLAGYLLLRRRWHGWAVLIGHTGVAVSGLTHPCGIIYAFDLLLLQWYFGGFRRMVGMWAWGSAPYVVFGAAFSVWVMQDWPSFVRQFGGNISGLAGEFGGTGRFSVLSQGWLGLEAEFQHRYMQSARGWAAQFSLWFYFAGVVWLAMRSGLRKQRRIRLLFAMGSLHFAFFWLFEGLKLTNYLLHLVPLLILLTVIALRDVLEGHRFRMAIGVGGLVLLNVLAVLENSGGELREKNYEPVVRLLEKQRGRVVTAPAEFAFAAGFDGQIEDDHRLGYYTGRKPDIFIANSWQRKWLDQADKLEPTVSKWIRHKLDDEYREIYRNETFVVWKKVQ